MSRYRHILIDADNTILDFSVCEKRILEDMAREYGFMPRTVEDEDLTTAYRRINGALWRALERGEIEADALKIERFRQLSELLDYTAITRPVPADLLNRQFIARLSRCGAVVPTAPAVLKAVAPVVVITNGFASVQRSRFAAAGLDRYVDRLFISEEVGYNKPDLRFFSRVLAELGDPDPAECVVVGDSLTSDIAGGNAAGMDTVWFDRDGEAGATGQEATGQGAPGSAETSAHPATYRITRLVELKAIVL
jgi:2-haloacid dehalogenase